MWYSSCFKDTVAYSDPFFKRMTIFIFVTHRRLTVIIAPYKFTQRYIGEGCLPIFIEKNLWRSVLEVNKKQASPESSFLKIRIDSVNQILKNKGKVT